MQTSAASGRPSLTYRRASTTDAPTVDRGGPNRPNADSRDSTTAPTETPRGSMSHDSGRERPRAANGAETGGDRTRSDPRSDVDASPKTGPTPRGSSVRRDDGQSRPADPHRPSIDRHDRQSAPRAEPSPRHTPDSDRRRRNRFDSVDVPSGTDPRFDADVDRAVQELYRKLERKIRIERERRGL